MGDAPAYDWTNGPAKWFAVGVLSTLATGALGWSVLRAPVQPLSAMHESTGPATQSPPLPHALPAPSIDGAGVPALAPAEPARAAHTLDTAAASEPRVPRTAKPALTRTINLNTAPAAELELLPGIGPALAQRIVDERATRGLFARVDDLDRVRGIGPKLLAKLRPHVSVE